MKTFLLLVTVGLSGCTSLTHSESRADGSTVKVVFTSIGTSRALSGLRYGPLTIDALAADESKGLEAAASGAASALVPAIK
jgi:hypothetical protein